MATTRIIKHHNTGGTIIASMKTRFQYGQNPEKTKGGELIVAYMCDPETAEAEFYLSKAQYFAITGREQKKDADVLCYQIRQSFKPGEVDGEAALKIGYDLAMRWTKGKHAFFVASHIDRPHPHVHIYYNSTSIDSMRKFRDFKGSAWALRRLSDRICYENNLSVIKNPKLKSKGEYKHYGDWLGADKPASYKERLKTTIDKVLSSQPVNFDAFLSMMVQEGYDYKWGRGGVLSFRTEEQERFTSLRSSTLGIGYDIDDIRSSIDNKVSYHVSRSAIKPRKINLVIDIQNRIRDGKGPAYTRWATVYNLKQMAAALQYLHENNLLAYNDLSAKAETATERYHTSSDKLRSIESAITRNNNLKSVIIDYSRTRPIFDEYKAKKYSNKFLAEHEAEIAVYRATQKFMRELLNGERLPKMDALKIEWQSLMSAKKSGYAEYRSAQKEMRDVITVKANIDQLLGLSEQTKDRGITR